MARSIDKSLWRKVFRRALWMACAFVAVGLLSLWFTFQHKPGWYKPPTLTEAQLREARREATNLIHWVSNELVHRKPFEVKLRESSVNNWLAGLGSIWPDAQKAIPSEIREAAVSFEGGMFRTGVHYERAGLELIANALITLSVSADRKEIIIAAKDIRGGSLPIPRAVLDDLLDRLINLAKAKNLNGDSGGNFLALVVQQIRSPDDLLAGFRIPNHFVWPNGRRPFRINSISIKEEQLTIRADPL